MFEKRTTFQRSLLRVRRAETGHRPLCSRRPRMVGGTGWLLVLILLTARCPALLAQSAAPQRPVRGVSKRAAEQTERPGPNQGSSSAQEDDRKSKGAEEPSSGGDELDQLLNLAEEDVGRLSEVNVTAPALQEVVSTVSRQQSTVGRSPAAVYVITPEKIRRSGATSIPELLRMVPGVQVARIDASKWAISARGFNGRFANKLLVQIDGRSVYTPLFGGVFWDIQDVVLEDIKRIEVIRGPGATMWGANAVNGIINIITKDASETQGSLLTSRVGTERVLTTGRVGGSLGADAHYRVYGKWFERDKAFARNNNAHDDWRMARSGFRVDWEPDYGDHVTLQGDYYDGTTGRRNVFPDPATANFQRTLDDDADLVGGNVLLRMTRRLSDDSTWKLQMYYDRRERSVRRLGFREQRNIVDVDFQQTLQLADRHSLIWGGGYRFTDDTIRDTPFVLNLRPDERSLNYFTYFIQDEITLEEDRLYLTGGSKFLHNSFTGFEIQPSVRLLWTPTPRHSIWGSVSRAVRLPTRGEDDVRIRQLPTIAPIGPGPPVPIFPVIIGSREIDSEELIAYETGIRHQPTQRFSWDLALFFNDYSNLITARPGRPTADPTGFPFPIVPSIVTNGLRAETYGLELATYYELTPWWRVSGNYSLLRMFLHAEDGIPSSAEEDEGASPRNQLYLQSSFDLPHGMELDLIGRYVDHLPVFGVPSYFVADARLGWQVTEHLEVSVVGRHLLDQEHAEFGSNQINNLPTQVQSEFFTSFHWRY